MSDDRQEQFRPIFFEGGGGLRLVGDEIGSGEIPVLLLHGGGQTRHSWRGTAQRFAVAGMRVVTYDARGHGDSEWSMHGDYRLSDFAEDLENVVGQLGGRAVLVGASLGGLSALALAGELNPHCAAAVVLVDIIPAMENAGAARIQSFMAERSVAGFASIDEAAECIATFNPSRKRSADNSGLRKNLRQRDGRWYWHWDPRFIGGYGDVPLNRVNDAVRLDAATTQATGAGVAIMLVRGRTSDLVTEDGARDFVTRHPQIEYADISGAGHMIVGDRNDSFTELTFDFLTAHGFVAAPSIAVTTGGHDD